MPESVEHLLPRLRDPEFTRVLIVTLPEATPVHEAAQLQRDLRRAEIEPYAWIINQSLAPLALTDRVLASPADSTRPAISAKWSTEHARRTAIVAWQIDPPVGYARLQQLSESINRNQSGDGGVPRCDGGIGATRTRTLSIVAKR